MSNLFFFAQINFLLQPTRERGQTPLLEIHPFGYALDFTRTVGDIDFFRPLCLNPSKLNSFHAPNVINDGRRLLGSHAVSGRRRSVSNSRNWPNCRLAMTESWWSRLILGRSIKVKPAFSGNSTLAVSLMHLMMSGDIGRG